MCRLSPKEFSNFNVIGISDGFSICGCSLSATCLELPLYVCTLHVQLNRTFKFNHRLWNVNHFMGWTILLWTGFSEANSVQYFCLFSKVDENFLIYIAILKTVLLVFSIIKFVSFRFLTHNS